MMSRRVFPGGGGVYVVESFLGGSAKVTLAACKTHLESEFFQIHPGSAMLHLRTVSN
jgi:hypothetical protein